MCQRCKSSRVVSVCGKTSDMCQIGRRIDYVPTDMGIGGNDYLRFQYCLHCGQIQGKFPLPLTKLESTQSESE